MQRAAECCWGVSSLDVDVPPAPIPLPWNVSPLGIHVGAPGQSRGAAPGGKGSF